MPFYLILCIQYTHIKQMFLVDRIKRFTAGIGNNKRRHLGNGYQSNLIWRQFSMINRKILQQFDELHAYNRFWAKFVTNYFVGYIAMIGYLAYGFIYDKSEFDWQKRSFFIFFTFETMATLIVITYECSTLVAYNVIIYKTNRAFCYTFGRLGQPRISQMLKVCICIDMTSIKRQEFRKEIDDFVNIHK